MPIQITLELNIVQSIFHKHRGPLFFHCNIRNDENKRLAGSFTEVVSRDDCSGSVLIASVMLYNEHEVPAG